MPYLIGTDEAGYGPNLGPLVISLTVWEVPDECLDRGIEEDLPHRLRDCIRSTPASSDVARPSLVAEPSLAVPLVIADSKSLYEPGAGLHRLEQGVLPAIGAFTTLPRRWSEIWRTLRAASIEDLANEPWFDEYDVELPRDADPEEMESRGAWLRRGLADCGTRIENVESRAVFPSSFNGLVERHGNKSSALSLITLNLVRSALARLPETRVVICCDKHGGRDRYCALLQSVFSESWIEIVREGRESSVYRWSKGGSRIECRFSARGESYLPTALASMVSKYLRELAMEGFNAFWCQRVRGLRPTAGYPVDAARFRSQIRSCQSSLGISDNILWRNR